MSGQKKLRDRFTVDADGLLLPADAYRLLQEYNVPVPGFRVAETPEEAGRLAEELGGPVAVKVFGRGLSHKSDVGGVRLGLKGRDEVKAAAEEMAARIRDGAPNAELAGFFVQQMAAPGGELLIGAKRDPVLGPAIVVGLGGVWVELFKDTSVRLAPLTRADAEEMLDERGAPLLRGYRGPHPVDRESVINILLAVSQLMMDWDDLVELDLNPVIAGPEGQGSFAVDARMAVSSEEPARRQAPDGAIEAIQLMMNPRNLAVIGASSNPAKIGGRLLRYIQKHGYPGQIYPVNPRADEIMGLKAYPSVLDVPGEVDLACIVVPAQAVLPAVKECIQKGIKAAIVYTSGFAETGEEGRKLQEELVKVAREGGMRLCGPNTVGLANPIVSTVTAFGMAFETETVPKGNIAFVTQSGALGGSLLSRSWEQGIGFSRWACTGNEADLTLADYVAYLAEDPHTSVIAVFMEAIRDPETFVKAAKVAAEAKKPIVAYKTGASEVGKRAVMSHTGSVAGDEAVYDAFFRKTGVVRVHDLQALADAAVALAWQPLPRGRNVAVVSTSGGACSIVADECEKMGLVVPPLRPETVERIREVIPPFGAAQNPVDVTMQVTVNPESFGQVLNALLDEPHIDALIMMLTTNADPPAVEVARGIVRAKERTDKPVIVARTGAEFLAPRSLEYYREHRIPVFPMPDRAVKALRAMVDYAEFLERRGR